MTNRSEPGMTAAFGPGAKARRSSERAEPSAAGSPKWTITSFRMKMLWFRCGMASGRSFALTVKMPGPSSRVSMRVRQARRTGSRSRRSNCLGWMSEMTMSAVYRLPSAQVTLRSSTAYGEAQRLLDLIRSVIAMTPVDVRHIPPTSIIREFIGGSSFHY